MASKAFRPRVALWRIHLIWPSIPHHSVVEFSGERRQKAGWKGKRLLKGDRGELLEKSLFGWWERTSISLNSRKGSQSLFLSLTLITLVFLTSITAVTSPLTRVFLDCCCPADLFRFCIYRWVCRLNNISRMKRLYSNSTACPHIGPVVSTDLIVTIVCKNKEAKVTSLPLLDSFKQPARFIQSLNPSPPKSVCFWLLGTACLPELLLHTQVLEVCTCHWISGGFLMFLRVNVRPFVKAKRNSGLIISHCGCCQTRLPWVDFLYHSKVFCC